MTRGFCCPPLELNEILMKLPRKGKVFAKNLRKSFQAACVKVGLGVEMGLKVWRGLDGFA
jgi:hypothetical protein